jgi:chromosome segregation protein
MPDSGKTKRPVSERLRLRDPRVDSSPPSARVETVNRRASRPRLEAAAVRIASLQAEVDRLTAERANDADTVAEMLVRIADAERAKTAANARAAEAERRAGASAGELDALHEELERRLEAFDALSRRVGVAEKSAADGADALERARADLREDRTRLVDLEAKRARMRREHDEAIETLLSTHSQEIAAAREAVRREDADAQREAALAVEQERSAAARARQQAAAAEVALTAARETIALATGLLEELERREEMVAALRARSLEQMRFALAGESLGAIPEDSVPPSAMVAAQKQSETRKAAVPDAAESGVLEAEELDLDLAE